MKHFFLAGAVATLALGPAVSAQTAKPITRSEFLKIVDAKFDAADTNHDGVLTKQEIAAQQERDLQQARAGIIQQLTAKFHQLDTNHDGQLSLQEFLAAAPSLHATETPDQILNRSDRNHDGKITREEFRAPQLATFNAADTNHDGIVSPAEAQAYAKAHSQTAPISPG